MADVNPAAGTTLPQNAAAPAVFANGDKRTIKVTGKRKLPNRTIIVPPDPANNIAGGPVTVDGGWWHEGNSTRGETIGFFANEDLTGQFANLEFRKEGTEYTRANGDKGATKRDMWLLGTSAATNVMKETVADLNTLREMGL